MSYVSFALLLGRHEGATPWFIPQMFPGIWGEAPQKQTLRWGCRGRWFRPRRWLQEKLVQEEQKQGSGVGREECVVSGREPAPAQPPAKYCNVILSQNLPQLQARRWPLYPSSVSHWLSLLPQCAPGCKVVPGVGRQLSRSGVKHQAWGRAQNQ